MLPCCDGEIKLYIKLVHSVKSEMMSNVMLKVVDA